MCLWVNDNFRAGNWTETKDHYDTLNLLIRTVADSSAYTLETNEGETAIAYSAALKILLY